MHMLHTHIGLTPVMHIFWFIYIHVLWNYMRIHFISIFLFSLLVEFENLGKAFTKAKAVVDKEGIPQFYIRSLTELEDFVKEVKQ